MQSVRWYLRRLRAMSAAEVLWRCHEKLRDRLDRGLLALRQRPVHLPRIMTSPFSSHWTKPQILGKHLDETPAGYHPEWQRELLDRADRIIKGRLQIFDLDHQYPDGETAWNFEPKAGKAAPLIYAPDIDYRDYDVTGDCKFVWEPNRHYHFVTLARAYRISGDERYAQAAVDQLESWIRQCPYGLGMNWRSPLEPAIRIINWVWTFALLQGSRTLTPQRLECILPVVYRHLWEIRRKFSRHSSANNHLIGEAAGVFIGSLFFSGLKAAQGWKKESREILLREIVEQSYADGVNREQAVGYHLFVLEFFLLAGLTARNAGGDFPDEYWKRLEKMFEFVATLREGGRALPMFGDADDGYVLDLGGRDDVAASLLSVGAILFQRGDFAAAGREFREPAWWLLGPEAERPSKCLRTRAPSLRMASRKFPDAGYYLLQWGEQYDPQSISVIFDCGELGFGSIAAHGHADALSFVLRIGGHDVLIDPGTYDYFTFAPWRQYFRSTRAHNTAVVDGANQSQMLGPFLWGARAEARCVHWHPSPDGGSVTGEHNGYRRLSDPVLHRRTITLDGPRQLLSVRDEIMAKGEHEVELYWHWAEDCRLCTVDDGVQIAFGGGTVEMSAERDASLELARGSQDPILGWVSRGYHRKAPITTLIQRYRVRGRRTIMTTFAIHPVPGTPAWSATTRRIEQSVAPGEPRTFRPRRVCRLSRIRAISKIAARYMRRNASCKRGTKLPRSLVVLALPACRRALDFLSLSSRDPKIAARCVRKRAVPTGSHETAAPPNNPADCWAAWCWLGPIPGAGAFSMRPFPALFCPWPIGR